MDFVIHGLTHFGDILIDHLGVLVMGAVIGIVVGKVLAGDEEPTCGVCAARERQGEAQRQTDSPPASASLPATPAPTPLHPPARSGDDSGQLPLRLVAGFDVHGVPCLIVQGTTSPVWMSSSRGAH